MILSVTNRAQDKTTDASFLLMQDYYFWMAKLTTTFFFDIHFFSRDKLAVILHIKKKSPS